MITTTPDAGGRSTERPYVQPLKCANRFYNKSNGIPQNAENQHREGLR